MKHISDLHCTKRGKTCNLVAHGESMRRETAPYMRGDETICVNCWRVKPDYLIFVDTFIRDFILRMGRTIIGIPLETRIISSEMCKIVSDYWFKVSDYPPNAGSGRAFKNGVRALYLACQMGYDKIYLYGYDFLRVDEDRHQGDAHLQKYLDQFGLIEWPKDRIVQTNPGSRLQFP